MTTLDVLTFNLNNPGRVRAERQLAYLAQRPEPVLVLTETADSAGCDLLVRRFEAAGYHVTFPLPGRGERGVMVVSRLATRPGPASTDYLPHRCVSVTVDTDEVALDVIGLYVPSRNATEVKLRRKRTFLEECERSIPTGTEGLRVVIGDFNILEPTHVPRYRFFQPFEYQFYTWLYAGGYFDAFRSLHPDALEYSWVGRTGDGYRYDHAHVSAGLATAMRGCSYLHEVRAGVNRLTDHSALTMSLALRPVQPLRVRDPVVDTVTLPALF
ncbi:endonuclease/exonuclease/phosphatase [Streptomyces sp. NPDC028722]|uniref:endonuclease/exonuclease/phosphatase n=1 Tax=Streptomyces sp. NPDC028722 TaxID=3155016 RepID=UPI0033FBEA52